MKKNQQLMKMPVQPKQALIDKRTSVLLTQAAAITVIKSEDHLIASGVVIQSIDDAVSWIEAVGSPFVSGLHKMHKQGVEWLKSQKMPLLTHKQRLLAIRMDYRRKKEQEQAAAAAKAAEELQKQQKRELEKQAKQIEKQGDEEAADVLREQAASVPLPFMDLGPAVPQQSGFAIRGRWKFDIIDDGLVPRQYCSPDLQKIRDQVNSLGDKHGIPGVVAAWEEKEHSR